MKRLCFLATVLSIGVAARVWGAGYAIDVQSGRATGMATAVTAFIDSAEAAYFNPAGLAQGRMLDLRVGLTPIVPAFKFDSANSGQTTDGIVRVTPPPHIYALYGITDQFSVGLGVFSPYGLVVPWPSNWEGNYLSIYSNLKTFYINPEVAYRVTDQIRIGAGVQIVRSTVELKQAIRLPGGDLGQVHLSGGTWGVGYNAGIQIDIIQNVLSFGGTWRSTVNSDITGRAHFSSIPPGLQSTLKDQNASTHLTLPGQFALGVAVQALPALKISFETDYIGWQVFQRLGVNFEDPTLNTVSPKNWTHTWNYHLGAEWAVNSNWRLRGGVMYDPTPSPQDTISPELPDANRVNIALGAGFQWDKFAIDAGYQLVVITNAKTTYPPLPGSYSGVANLLSVTFGFHL